MLYKTYEIRDTKPAVFSATITPRVGEQPTMNDYRQRIPGPRVMKLHIDVCGLTLFGVNYHFSMIFQQNNDTWILETNAWKHTEWGSIYSNRGAIVQEGGSLVWRTSPGSGLPDATDAARRNGIAFCSKQATEWAKDHPYEIAMAWSAYHDDAADRVRVEISEHEKAAEKLRKSLEALNKAARAAATAATKLRKKAKS